MKQSISGAYCEWVARFSELNDDNLSTLKSVTYDTLVGWMKLGMVRYMDSPQITLPILFELHKNGGKIIHFHKEQDEPIPTRSLVHHYNSVRQTMYLNKSCNFGTSAPERMVSPVLGP